MAIQDRLQAVRKVRIYEEIVAQITALILDGGLKSGDRLPSERELCEQFGVGRNSVREATRALESARLVETRQGEGTFVTADPASLLPALSEQISSEGESGMRHLFEARRLLEPQIAALAAERAGPEEVNRLEEIIERQRAEVEAERSGMDEDTAFHLTLAKAAKNEFLHRLLAPLLDSLRELREHSIRKKPDRLRSIDGHVEILEAVRERNVKTSLARMLSHLLGVEGQGMDIFRDKEIEGENSGNSG